MSKKVMAASLFWKNVDYLLKQKASYQTELSEAIGVEYGSLTIQKHRRTLPKYEQLLNMADFFNISLDELMTMQEETSDFEKRLLRIRMRLPEASEEVLYCIEKLLDIPVEKKIAVSNEEILTNVKSLEEKE